MRCAENAWIGTPLGVPAPETTAPGLLLPEVILPDVLLPGFPEPAPPLFWLRRPRAKLPPIMSSAMQRTGVSPTAPLWPWIAPVGTFRSESLLREMLLSELPANE